MPTLPNVNPTLMDLTKQLAPDGSVDTVAEILNQTNEGLDEMTWQEGNLPTGHRHTVRTGLPYPTWARLYKGVKPSRGTTAQVTDNTAILESLSEVDTRLVRLASDPVKFRFNEDRPHIEAISQEFFQTLFYGGQHEVDKFVGLSERFNTRDLDEAANAENVLHGGGPSDATDLTSLWLIAWSPRTAFGIVPRGSAAGIQQRDMGEDWVYDSDGGRFRAYITHFEWSCGLAVPDWRYVVRAANISLSALTDDGSSGTSLPHLAHDMIERMPSDAFGSTRVAFYANRRLITKWRKQTEAGVANSTLRMEEVGAVGERLSPKKKYVFDGIPVNRVDALRLGEAFVDG